MFTKKSSISENWQEQLNDLVALLDSESFQAIPIRTP